MQLKNIKRDWNWLTNTRSTRQLRTADFAPMHNALFVSIVTSHCVQQGFHQGMSVSGRQCIKGWSFSASGQPCSALPHANIPQP